MTKSEILEWYCRKSDCSGRDEGFCIEFIECDNKRQCDDYTELSAMLDELIESVPEFTATIWNEEIILKIQEWKQEAGK